MTLEQLRDICARIGLQPPESLDAARLQRVTYYAVTIVETIGHACNLPGHAVQYLTATFYDADIHMLTGQEIVAYEQRAPAQDAALQELVDQAQELDMGYGQSGANKQPTGPNRSTPEAGPLASGPRK